MTSFIRLVVCVVVWGIGCGGEGQMGMGDGTRGYQKVLSLRHFPHSDSTMLHT